MRECSPPPQTCHVSHVMCQMSHVKCHVSHVTCHMSHVTCQMSIILFIYFFYKVVKLFGGGSVINGAYPVYFFNILKLDIGVYINDVNNTMCGVPDLNFVRS